MNLSRIALTGLKNPISEFSAILKGDLRDFQVSRLFISTTVNEFRTLHLGLLFIREASTSEVGKAFRGLRCHLNHIILKLSEGPKYNEDSIVLNNNFIAGNSFSYFNFRCNVHHSRK